MTNDDYIVEIREVTPRVVVATDNNFFDMNAAAIALENFIIIIDTLFFPIQSRQLRDFIEKKFDLPVKYVFFSHIDGDHIYGADTFRGAEIIASHHLGPRIKKRLAKDWYEAEFDEWRRIKPEHTDAFNEIEILLPNIEFEKEYVISDGPYRIEFYYSGGHTSCSAWAYFPKDKIVFTGDELASYNWPLISDKTGNPDEWIDSFKRILSLDVDIVVPGHGKIVDKNHLREHLEFMKKIREMVVDAIGKGRIKDEVEVPEFYPPTEDWRIPEALEHLYKFYSTSKQ